MCQQMIANHSMLSARRVLASAVLATAGLALAAPAQAQRTPARPYPVIQLSAGYGAMHDTDSGQTLPVAWLASGGIRVSERVSIVAELDGSYKTATVGDVRVNYRSHGLLAGIRVPFTARRGITPFVQGLIGGVCHCGSTLSNGRFSTGLATQIGGGADLAVSKALGVRVQADLRNVRDQHAFFNQTRVAIGAVFGIFRVER
jgi:hypothetical protein